VFIFKQINRVTYCLPDSLKLECKQSYNIENWL